MVEVLQVLQLGGEWNVDGLSLIYEGVWVFEWLKSSA